MSTKEDIIQAATRLFAEKGYEGMTMKEIAREVGIKPPSLYAFFKSKEDIFMHIYRGIISGHLQLAISNAETFFNQPAKAQLEQLLYQVIEFQFKESVEMKILIRLMIFPPVFIADSIKEEMLRIEKKEHDLLCGIFKRAMENGEIKQGDFVALATSMHCMMDGLFWEMQRYDESTFNERFAVIWKQFWKGVEK